MAWRPLILLGLAGLAACATGAGRARRARAAADPLSPPSRSASDAAEPPATSDALARRMGSAHRARGRGRPAATEMVRGALGCGEEQGYTIDLVGSACYALLAVGESDSTDVDLLLVDARGAEVAEDSSRQAVAAIEVCPPRDGRYTAVVRMYAGSGGFAFQVFGS